MRFMSFLKALWPVNWYLLILTIIVFTVLVKLGLWQSDRAYEKELRIAKIATLTEHNAQPLDLVMSELAAQTQTASFDEKTQELLNDLPVELSGTFESNVLFLLDNQSNEGRLGYRVFQLFNHLDKLTHQPLLVLVNLGWVQGSINRQELPDISVVKGDFTLTGHIRFMEKGIVLTNENLVLTSWPIRVQSIELDKISRLIDKQLLPFVVFLDKKEQLGYEKNWQPIVMPPEKHRGYAFQWFSLATAWLLLMIWAAIKSNVHNSTNNNKK